MPNMFMASRMNSRRLRGGRAGAIQSYTSPNFCSAKRRKSFGGRPFGTEMRFRATRRLSRSRASAARSAFKFSSAAALLLAIASSGSFSASRSGARPSRGWSGSSNGPPAYSSRTDRRSGGVRACSFSNNSTAISATRPRDSRRSADAGSASRTYRNIPIEAAASFSGWVACSAFISARSASCATCAGVNESSAVYPDGAPHLGWCFMVGIARVRRRSAK